MVGWEHDADLLPIVRTHMGLQKLEDSGALVSILYNQHCTGLSRGQSAGSRYCILHYRLTLA